MLFIASQKKLRVLCTREFQKTIADSVHKLLKDTIQRLNLEYMFDVTDNVIRCTNGSEFIFLGLHANVSSIKSLEGVDICWIEEAETVAEESWRTLIPTIRKEGSEIWVTFNPRDEKDATSKRFLTNPPPNSWCIEVNWRDNKFFPSTLRAEMEHDYRVDPDSAAHVWGGKFRQHSDAQIFRGKYKVEEFSVCKVDGTWDHVYWDGPWFGVDWGFSKDPLSAHQYWGHGNTLYVEYEVYKPGVELNHIADTLRRELPRLGRHVIRADNSRPETISYLAGQGLNIVAAKKWPGSVEDGISVLRSLESIVIHPRCTGSIVEAREYRYKKDRITGDVLNVIVDKDNHFWDDCRYAMDELIQAKEHTYQTEYDAVHEEQVGLADIDTEADYLYPSFSSF